MSGMILNDLPMVLEISLIENRDKHFKYSSAIGKNRHKCNQRSFIEALRELRGYIAIEHDIDLNRLKVEMNEINQTFSFF